MVNVEARLEGEDVRARLTHVEPLEQAASRVQKGIRIFLRDSRPLGSIAERLKIRPQTRAEGEVLVIVMLEQTRREVEIRLPGRYPVTPHLAGALKAVPGVVAIEHL